ncbi:hypothetical protein [Hyphomicrobium zavarzinii]|uniref:hypothetical protein n=1 Tax=Hyphomicrobium zavarzinii TaxID=48292 RepID=UPI0003812F2B|nr:hypothetical protein [Hyphomicrobium zavarzinii]
MTSHTVWTVAADTVCEGWAPATIHEDEVSYTDVYLTRIEAEQELADIISERLCLFIKSPESYDGINDALNSGFSVIEAVMRADGTILIDGQEEGTAPPSIRSAIANLPPTMESPLQTNNKVQNQKRNPGSSRFYRTRKPT